MFEKMEEWGKAILRAAIILVILYFFFWPIRLSGSSMEPTLNDGDLVFMSRATGMAHRYEKNDIIVFAYHDENGKKTVLKRIIATEGDHIQVLADGMIAVNGEIMKEEYTNGRTDGLVDLIVPAGMVFVLGDNREVSFDSRHIGVISKEDIQAKVLLRWYPFQEAKIF